MSKYEDAVVEHRQFIEDVEQARDQFYMLNEMYKLYKAIDATKLQIEELSITIEKDISENLKTFRAKRGLLQDDLKEMNNEYEARFSSVQEIDWPVMGENYVEYMTNNGIDVSELGSVFTMVTETTNVPKTPERNE